METVRRVKLAIRQAIRQGVKDPICVVGRDVMGELWDELHKRDELLGGPMSGGDLFVCRVKVVPAGDGDRISVFEQIKYAWR